MSDVSDDRPYLLVGANIRFLAENAVRHGHKVFTIDHYGDWDTRKLAPNRSIMRDGDGELTMMALVELAQGIDNDGVVFGPGFENDIPALVTLRRAGALLGCGVDSIRSVRNPEALARAASTWNFKYAPILHKKADTPLKGRWLVKPVDGMGGAGIRDVCEPVAASDRPVYYQRHIEGIPSSAVVVSNGSDAAVLGVLVQIVGDSAFGADGFRFVGAIYPHPFSRETAGPVTTIAEALTLEFDLKGLWGFDFIYDGEVTLIEVNPRPTAGMGVLGAATLNDLLAIHIHSVKQKENDLIIDPYSGSGYTAHARVFAISDGVFTGAEDWLHRGARDIPHDGESIPAGSPILTVAACGVNYNGVMTQLKEEAEALQSSLTRHEAAPAF